mmetsp:Transcript_95929/g.266496  ORF Transcript_95929/g.266496 Transcript_95929/m.266496 type:complete len:203 (+) Transcript_95929:532-1140(+)
MGFQEVRCKEGGTGRYPGPTAAHRHARGAGGSRQRFELTTHRRQGRRKQTHAHHSECGRRRGQPRGYPERTRQAVQRDPRHEWQRGLGPPRALHQGRHLDVARCDLAGHPDARNRGLRRAQPGSPEVQQRPHHAAGDHDLRQGPRGGRHPAELLRRLLGLPAEALPRGPPEGQDRGVPEDQGGAPGVLPGLRDPRRDGQGRA